MDIDIQELFNSLLQQLGASLPGVLKAVGLLVVGWFVALFIRAVLRKALGLAQLNQRLQASAGSALDVEGGIASGGYYLVLTLALIAFFNALDLQLVSEPLQAMVQKVLLFLPNLISGAVLFLVAWIIATVLKRLVSTALSATRLDERLNAEAGLKPMSENLGNVVYGLVLLLFLPAILGALGLQGLLEPIQSMVDEILAMLPNVLAAGIIGVVGWFVARVLRNLVQNLLAAAGADQLGERAGLKSTMSLSNLVGLLVFIFVFIPALIAALNAIEIESISAPATDMLGAMMAAVPSVFAAGAILAVAIFVSRLVGGLATSLLSGMGFDSIPGHLGVGAAFGEENTLSSLVGKLLVFFILLFASVEAANVLGFTQMTDLVADFIQFGGDVLLGVVIIAVGLWISNLAYQTLARSSSAGMLAGIARFTILGVVLAMGLGAMGIADSIVDMAFGLTLGAVAVAVALSFGLGGREAAGRQMEYWLSKLRPQ